jgi:hypothetical protein
VKSEPGDSPVLWHKSRELETLIQEQPCTFQQFKIYECPISNFNNETYRKLKLVEAVLHNLSDTTCGICSENENGKEV